MASPRTSIPSHGYTLAEILIIVGLILILIGISLFIDLRNYFGDAFRAERNTIVTVLQAARANALNNVDQTTHGVAFHPADRPHSYVLFEGGSYAASDPTTRRAFDESYPVAFDQASPSEIVFCQLSGDAARSYGAGGSCEDDANAFDGTITMSDPSRGISLSISINHEGAISW